MLSFLSELLPFLSSLLAFYSSVSSLIISAVFCVMHNSSCSHSVCFIAHLIYSFPRPLFSLSHPISLWHSIVLWPSLTLFSYTTCLERQSRPPLRFLMECWLGVPLLGIIRGHYLSCTSTFLTQQKDCYFNPFHFFKKPHMFPAPFLPALAASGGSASPPVHLHHWRCI